MTWTPRILTLVAVVLALAGCAATQNTVGDLLGRNEGFNSLDTNDDGVLSQAELQALPDLADSFDRIDTNNDSNVNRNEFRAANTRLVEHGFQDLDLNEDGVISEREADAARRSLRETFSEVDADQDGNVSQAEYQAATHNLLQKSKFQQADLDGDGVIDRREAERHPVLNAQFDAMDINSDSLVGQEEFAWAQR